MANGKVVTLPIGCCHDDCDTIVVAIPGIAGPAGLPGNGAGVFNEIPSGIKNGANLTFTLAFTPQSGSTQVHRNGLREYLGIGYSESVANIVFTTAPLVTDVLTVDYLIGP
jgi:hypothetical protein